MSEKLTNSQIADAFLEAISSDNEAIFSDVCAHDMIIWHNVDREDKLFREYVFYLMSIRRIASQWNYKVIRHIETSSGFARQLMVEGADKNGQKFVAATSMFVDIVDGKIARIDEYFNPTDVACLLEAMPT